MKKLLFLFLVTFFSISSFAQYRCIPHLYEYGNPGSGIKESSLNTSYSFIFSSGQIAPAWSAVKPIWFPFYFNGQLVTHYKVSTTGVLTFDTTATLIPPLNNNVLPDPQIPDNSICIRGLVGSYILGTNDINYDSPTLNYQQWICFQDLYNATVNPTGSSRWAIVLEANSNNIYIVERSHAPTLVAPLTLGIQINNTTAYMASGSPNITYHSLNSGYTADNVYYAFTPEIPLNVDGTVINSAVPQYISMANAPLTMGARFRNLGSDTIHSLELHYNIDGGATITQTFTGIDIPSGGVQWLNFNSSFAPIDTGNYILDIWADNLNGNLDEDTSNDHYVQETFVAPVLPPRRALFEEVKGTWCHSSGYWTYRYDSIIGVNYIKASSIKYEEHNLNLSYYFDVNKRKQFYHTTAVPTSWGNGKLLQNDPLLFAGCPWNVTQSVIDSLYSLPGLFYVQPQLNINGYTANITGTITSAVKFNTSARCKIYASVLEDTITYATPQGSSYETKFINTSRRLMPSSNGQYIGTPQFGQIDSLNYSFTITDTTVNLSRLRVVVFIQDTVTKEIYQCAESPGIIDCASEIHKTYHHLCGNNDSVMIGGNWVNIQGVYPTNSINSNGCDSLHLDVVIYHYMHCNIVSSTYGVGTNFSPNYSPNTDIITYQWYDHTYQQIVPGANTTFFQPTHSGMYSLIMSNQAGCTFTSNIVNFTCRHTFQQYVNICNGDSLQVFDNWYTNAGNYVDTLFNPTGCDSIVTTNIYVTTINNSYSVIGSNGTLLAPAGFANYQWIDCNSGATLSNSTYFFVAPYSGTFKTIVTSSNGCSVELPCVSLTTSCAPNNTQQSYTICNGDSILIGNIWQSNPGTYSDTLIMSNGCWNIVTTTLTETTIDNALSIQGDTIFAPSGYANYEWMDCANNIPISNSASHIFIPANPGFYKALITSNNGCTELSDCTPYNVACISSSTQQTISVCTGDSIQVGFNWHAIAGTYIDSLISVTGCDSIVTTQLSETIINDSIFISSDTIIASPGYAAYQWIDCATNLSIPNATGHIFIAPYEGSFKTLIASSNGCAQFSECILYNVACISSNAQQIVSVCAGDSIQVGLNWHAIAGTYTDSLISLAGCDSIVTTQLSEIFIDTTLVLIGDTIYATSGYNNYEWIDCNTNLAIPNATSHIFVAPYAGNFKTAIINNNNCAAISSCISIVITAISDNISIESFSLIPNPANDFAELNFNVQLKNGNALLTDLNGKIIQTYQINSAKTILSLVGINAGIYYLKLYENNQPLGVKKLVVIK
jgi:hypothetical protein